MGENDRKSRTDPNIWSIYYILIKQYEEDISGSKMFGIAKKISETLLEKKSLPRYISIIKNNTAANKASDVINVGKNHANQFYNYIRDLLFEELKKEGYESRFKPNYNLEIHDSIELNFTVEKLQKKENRSMTLEEICENLRLDPNHILKFITRDPTFKKRVRQLEVGEKGDKKTMYNSKQMISYLLLEEHINLGRKNIPIEYPS